jgi:hypothetical protein
MSARLEPVRGTDSGERAPAAVASGRANLVVGDRPRPRSAPPFADAGGERRTRPSLPLPTLLPHTRADDVRVVVTPVGRDGRLADRSVLRFLDWSETQAVVLSVEPGPLIVIRPGAGPRVGRRCQLRLPLAIRRRLGITTGDRLLVVADRAPGQVLVLPMPVLANVIAAMRAPDETPATP